MDFENKSLDTSSVNSAENNEKKGKGVWKHVGLIAVALCLAVLTVIIINL